MRILLLAPDERDLLGGLLRGAAPGAEVVRPVTRSGTSCVPCCPTSTFWSGIGAVDCLGRSGSRDRWASAAASATGRRCELDRRGSVAAGGGAGRQHSRRQRGLGGGVGRRRDREPEPVDGLGARPAPRRGVAAGADSGPRLSRPRSAPGGDRRVRGHRPSVRRSVRAFGCEVAYTARRPRSDAPARYLPFDDLLAVSDVLVLAVPLMPSTRGLIGASELARLPEEAIVVNVARGPVVRTDALVAGLRSGRLGGAALDVFDHEPPAADSELRRLDRSCSVRTWPAAAPPRGAGSTR